ncbi:hypothetical protein [Paracoccus halophilus]|nr:hypothetical protein [Paracoccus halophilus]
MIVGCIAIAAGAEAARWVTRLRGWTCIAAGLYLLLPWTET